MRRSAVMLAFALGLFESFAACSPSPPPALPERIEHLEGRVIEQLDAPPYSFLRVKTADQEVWAAAPISGYGIGSAVSMKGCVAVRNHLIRSQNRRLDVVYFGTLAQAP